MTDGGDGQGIRPSGNNTYTVWGDLTLPCGITIPEGATVNVPWGTSVTVPPSFSLTNNGTVTGDGSLKGEGFVTNNGTMSVAHNEFMASVYAHTSDSSAAYGDGVYLYADVTKPAGGPMSGRTVTFYRGTVAEENQLGEPEAVNGYGYAHASIQLTEEGWKPSETAYTIIAVYTPPETSTMIESSGSCTITVTKAGQSLSSPTAVEVTATSVTLNAVTGTGHGKVTYACVKGKGAPTPASDSDEWQASPKFTDLEPGTTYTFFARCEADEYYEEATSSAEITTERADSALTVEPSSAKLTYGDTLTVKVTPGIATSNGVGALDTAQGTVELKVGDAVLASAGTADADGSYTLAYDTKEKRLPIGEDLTLTVSYGGSGALNPAEETVTLTLDKAILKNVPSVSGNFVYGETLTANYRKQGDETVTYQWYRGGEIISSATEASYTPTAEDIGKNILVEVIATDEWHGGRVRSAERVVSKAPGGIEIACDSVAYGEAVRPSVTGTTNEGANVTFSYVGTGGTSYGPSAAAPTAPGTYAVTATVAETDTHTGATSELVSFSIARPYVPPVSPSGPDWGDVADELAGAERGGRVVVDMDGETDLPGEVLEALAGRDVTLVLEMEGGVSWEIWGGDVPAGVPFDDLDMGVETGTDGIPVSVTNLVTGEAGVVQVALAHDGEFGFALTLVAPLGEKNEGLHANLYCYDEAAGLLRFEASSVVGDGGVARLRLDHASQWAVALDGRSHELPFPDAAEGEWYSEPLRWAWLSGVVAGYGDGTVGPGRAVTRAEAAAVLWNAAGQPGLWAGDPALPADVPSGEWYSAPVAWALASGAFSGNGDGSFSPSGELTREQAACVLHNRARAAGEDVSARADLSEFADAASVSAWASDAMSWAVAEGVISGTGDGLLEPGRAIARSELCATLMSLELRG